MYETPELLRHESRSSVNQVKEVLADHLQEGIAASAAIAKASQPPTRAISVAKTQRVNQPTHTRTPRYRDNHLPAVKDMHDMPELLRHESRSSVNQVKEILADHIQDHVAASTPQPQSQQVQQTHTQRDNHPSAISFAKTPRVRVQPTRIRTLSFDLSVSAVKDMYDMPELLRHQSTSSVSSKLMAREILGIDSSERSATPKNAHAKHIEIANISQIESIGSEDDQLLAFMNEFRDDLESQRGDDNDHTLK